MRLTVLSKNQQQPPAKTETKKNIARRNDTRHIHTHTNKIKEKE